MVQDPEEREALRRRLVDNFGSFDVAVATYEVAKNKTFRSSLVQGIHWRVLVLDEGHIIKCRDTEISQVVRKMHFQFAMLLTGTPLQNNLTELWSLLNFLYPDVFESSAPFDEAFTASDFTLNDFAYHNTVRDGPLTQLIFSTSRGQHQTDG